MIVSSVHLSVCLLLLADLLNTRRLLQLLCNCVDILCVCVCVFVCKASLEGHLHAPYQCCEDISCEDFFWVLGNSGTVLASRSLLGTFWPIISSEHHVCVCLCVGDVS